MYRRYLSSALLLLISAPFVVHAALIEFDHIEYDPSGSDDGREWVRIHNVSGAPVDISNWRFVEGGTNHKLRGLSGSTIPAGGFAIIADDAAQYAIEHPNSTDVLFDSSFSLSNTGELLALKNASSTIVAETAYTATPKPKPEPVAKVKPKVAVKKSEPRLLQKETPKVTATAVDAPATQGFGFWPWLLAAVVLGVGVGAALWFLRGRHTESGYTVIDISDKSP